MIILIDTREQPTDRSIRRYKSFGCPSQYQTLKFCDYSVNFKLPNGDWAFPIGGSIAPVVAIERKANLTELSNNLIQEKERFEREFQRGKDAGAKMYLLIEEGTMEKMYSGKYRTKVHPNAYTSSLWAIVSRYNLHGPIFCKPELSGRVIHDILYREIKEMLERGDFG